MSQSERAAGRVRGLRVNFIKRLRAHEPLVDLLERGDWVENGAEVIEPSPDLDAQHRASEAPDIAVGVMLVTSSSNRENAQERVSLVAQAEVQVREKPMKRLGTLWLDNVTDEIAAVATSHDTDWRALGATGGTPEPLWDEDINRYRTAARYDIESWG